MKAETILARVNKIIEQLEESDSLLIKTELSNLADDLAGQVRMEYATSRGQGSATRAIISMLNNVKHSSINRALAYAWGGKNGRQCVCDGFRAFRLTEFLPLEERPDDAGEPVDLDKVLPNLNGYVTMPLPSAQEVKSFIALERAKYGRRYIKEATKVWDFGKYRPAVNVHYLLDLITVLPDASKIFYNPVNLCHPLYAKSERGEAILLPVITPEKRIQHEKIKMRKLA